VSISSCFNGLNSSVPSPTLSIKNLCSAASPACTLQSISTSLQNLDPRLRKKGQLPTTAKMKLQLLILVLIVFILNAYAPVLANPAELSTFSTSISPSTPVFTPPTYAPLVGRESADGSGKSNLHIDDEPTPSPSPKPPSKGLKKFEKVMLIILCIVILVVVLVCYCVWKHRKGLAVRFAQVAMHAAI